MDRPAQPVASWAVRLKDMVSSTIRPFLSRAEWATNLPETRARCESCIQARGPAAIYKDSLKCCTFFPWLPNFMIGAIFESSLPGRSWLEERLAARAPQAVAIRGETGGEAGSGASSLAKSEAVAVPLGLFPALTYQRRWHARQPQGYGNDETLLCPHFVREGGVCGIWSQRPSTCVAFFCESSYGLAGTEFWAKFEKYVSALELALAQEALLSLGLTLPEIELSARFRPRYGAPDPHGFTGAKLQAEEARAWVEMGGDKIGFYRQCHEIVRSLAPRDGEALMGEDGAAAAEELFGALLPRLLA